MMLGGEIETKVCVIGEGWAIETNQSENFVLC